MGLADPVKMVAVALIVSGCSLPLPDRPAVGQSVSRCATGIVGTTGPDPFAETVLRRTGEGALVLGGAVAERLRLLVGAVVTACGTSEADGSLSVDAWELRQIDGMQAYFGRVEAAGETILLGPGGERPPIPLGDVPNDLRRSVGREAWVAGLWMAGAFSVRSFGIFPAP